MLFYLVLLAFALGEPSDCTASQAYWKITKVNTLNASYQSHVIQTTNGDSVHTSQAYSNSETRTNDGCASGGTNHQYRLILKSTTTSQWYQGSYLTVFGPYDNIVFKGYRHTTADENYPLSLYIPIKKSSPDWKFTNSPGSGDGWIATNFDHSSWTTVELGDTGSVSTSGTQFFRKSFTGVTGLAAYEIRFFYRYGILAYMNGVEIIRDNLSEGTVAHDATATGSYSESEWRGTVRNAYTIAATSAVAIEYHFLSATTTMNFNAWLALYAASSLATESTYPCYRFYYPFTISGESATSNPANAIDMNFGTYSYKYIPNSSYTPAEYYITYSGSVSFQANGFEDFPYAYPTYQPKNYIVSASKTSSSEYVTVASVIDATYTNMVKKYAVYHFATGNYRRWKIAVASTSQTYLYFWEFAPCVCALEIPSSITFSPASTNTHAGIETIRMAPTYHGLSGCTVNPALPTGVILTSATCTISGVPKLPQSATTYTITTSSGLTGTVSITATVCNGSGVELKRTYSYNAIYDTYVIKDAGGTTVKEMTYNSGQADQITVTERACWTGTRFQITTSSYSLTYWYYNSFIYISSIFGEESELVLRANFDSQLKIPNQYWFSLYRPIAFESEWKYKGAESSSTWYSMSTSSWTGYTKGNYPDSTNRFQVYRKTFNVDGTALSTAGGFSIALRYKYGTVIRMNGVEVFRNNVDPTGDLSSLTANAIYSQLMYRYITLPVKTMKVGEQSQQEILKSGSNEIGIAMISSGDSVKTSDFDCSIRLFGQNEVERVLDYTVTLTNVYYAGYSSFYDDAFMKMAWPNYYYYTCTDNSVQIVFNNDRKEWISSTGIQSQYDVMDYQVGRFIFEGKNPEDSTWVTLATVTNLRWWIVGQKKKLYFVNNKSFNMYRWRNFYRTDTSQCEWRINQLYLWSDNTGVQIDTLAYTATHEAYRNIEMAEIYPSSGQNYRYNFTISPVLPTGLFIDSITGVLMGTATVKQVTTIYTVSALDITGTVGTATLSLTVVDCTGGKSLVSSIIHPDYNYYSYVSFKLFRGQDTTGTIVRQLSQMPSDMKYWVDECLPHDMYVFQVNDSQGYGWEWPSGIFLTVDRDRIMMNFDHFAYTYASTNKVMKFSSYLPLELEFTEYKAFYGGGSTLPANWHSVGYTETSAWVNKLAPNFGTVEYITLYLRKTFEIQNVDDFPVMNVHCQYGGGLVAYFNGRKVARFNLAEKFDMNTEAPVPHDDSRFSKFHVIPKAEGVVKGENVMAFELHRPKGASSTSAIIFDATAVFGVEECNIVINGYLNVSGHEPIYDSLLTDVFDQNPATFAYFANDINTHLYWYMENLERTRFNKYVIAAYGGYSGYGWSVFGRHQEDDLWIEISTETNVEMTDRTKIHFNTPIGMAGFRYYKWVLNTPGGYYLMPSEIATEYCIPKGATICPAVDDYPPVAQGERSPSICPRGYTGYAYRTCVGGILSDEKLDACKMLPPANLVYPQQYYVLVRDTNVLIPSPTFDNIIESFYVDPQNPLPMGLEVDMRDGKITGRPTQIQQSGMYKIYGKNAIAITHVEIAMSVKQGECEPSGDFKRTPVGEMAVFDCEMKGSYMGTQKRACLLGEHDGEWGPSSGFCISYLNVVIIVLLVIVMIIVLIFVFTRSIKKSSKSGGVRKGSSKTSSKKGSRKESSKAATKV